MLIQTAVKIHGQPLRSVRGKCSEHTETWWNKPVASPSHGDGSMMDWQLLGRVGNNDKAELGLTELPWQDFIYPPWLFQWFPNPVLPKRPSIENPRAAKFGEKRRNNSNIKSSLFFPPNHCFPQNQLVKSIQIQIWASPQSCYWSIVPHTEQSKSTIIRNKPVDPEEFVPVPPWILVL